MTTAHVAAGQPPSAWTRFCRRLAAFEEDLSLGYDGWQDKRIAYLEAELRTLKEEVGRLRSQKAGAAAPARGEP